jgi:hypothetical protein
VVRASAQYGLLTPGLECAGMYEQVATTRTGAVGEWGQEFTAWDSDNNPTATDCINLTMPSVAKLQGRVPANRHEALALMQTYFNCRVDLATTGGNKLKVAELTANMFFGEFAVQLGRVSVVAAEVVNWNAQQQVAFARGTAKQHELPWAVDVSPWASSSILDYSTARFWGKSSSPLGGRSLSAFKRNWYTSFMAGANHLEIEGGGVNLFFENTTADGVMRLSPLGQQARSFYAFTADGRRERGVPYVPIGVVLEAAHGFGISLIQTWRGYPSTWGGAFHLSGAEELAWELMQELLPGAFLDRGFRDNFWSA